MGRYSRGQRAVAWVASLLRKVLGAEGDEQKVEPDHPSPTLRMPMQIESHERRTSWTSPKVVELGVSLTAHRLPVQMGEIMKLPFCFVELIPPPERGAVERACWQGFLEDIVEQDSPGVTLTPNRNYLYVPRSGVDRATAAARDIVARVERYGVELRFQVHEFAEDRGFDGPGVPAFLLPNPPDGTLSIRLAIPPAREGEFASEWGLPLAGRRLRQPNPFHEPLVAMPG